MTCNEKCKMCYLFGENRSALNDSIPGWTKFLKSQMPFDMFTRLVDNICDNNLDCSFFIMGGEPMLHPDISQMCTYIKEHSKGYVDINTNGTVEFTKYSKLIEAKIDRIIFSLESAHEDEHNAIMGNNTFKKIVNNIISCRKYIYETNAVTKIALNTTIVRDNYERIVDLLDLAVELGVDDLYMNLPMIIPEDDGTKSEEVIKANMNLDFHTWKGFQIPNCYKEINIDMMKKNIDILQNKYDASVINVTMVPHNFSSHQLDKYFSGEWGNYVTDNKCPSLAYRTTVLPNGDVIPCTVFCDLVVGNINEHSIYDIWENERYNKFRHLLGDKLLPMCYRCCDMLDESDGTIFHSFS